MNVIVFSLGPGDRLFSPSIMLSPTVWRFGWDAFFAVGPDAFFAAIQGSSCAFFGFTVFFCSSILAWRRPIPVFAKTNPFFSSRAGFAPF
jgi:hypothetical protein